MTTVLRSAASPVYNRLFWLTYAANTVLVLANALTFRFAEFVTFLGGSEQLTGTVISVGVLCAVAVRFRLGHDIDACGTRRLWLTSTLLFAAACGLRIATAGSRFGVPIARTVGNCLSMANYARLVAGFGAARAKRMLLLGEILDADEARACGFLAEIVEKDALDDAVTRILAAMPGAA